MALSVMYAWTTVGLFVIFALGIFLSSRVAGACLSCDHGLDFAS